MYYDARLHELFAPSPSKSPAPVVRRAGFASGLLYGAPLALALWGLLLLPFVA